jgi:thiopeptide-type bacteriocin biosynthesis protein
MDWVSIHLYPKETQDLFLSRALKPFLEQYIWPKKDSRAFFIRYQDEKGPHLRLRFKAEQDWLNDHLLPAFEGWFVDRGEWALNEYVPEPERFGGGEALAWAEEYFHVSTRVVLDRISREQFTYGDAMFDALRMHLITAHAAGLNLDKTRWYFSQLYLQWRSLFLPPDEKGDHELYSELFEKTLGAQRYKIVENLDAFWKSIGEDKLDKKQPEWIRWVRGNELILKGLGGNLDKALPSLIHLNNNRLGIRNEDEVYLNYILWRTL